MEVLSLPRICMVLLISISRFTSIEAEGSNIENIWIWLGLYVR